MLAYRRGLADDGEHSRWHAKTIKDIPQKASVDGVVCFGEVDKAHVQGGAVYPADLLSRRFRGGECYKAYFG